MRPEVRLAPARAALPEMHVVPVRIVPVGIVPLKTAAVPHSRGRVHVSRVPDGATPRMRLLAVVVAMRPETVEAATWDHAGPERPRRGTRTAPDPAEAVPLPRVRTVRALAVLRGTGRVAARGQDRVVRVGLRLPAARTGHPHRAGRVVVRLSPGAADLPPRLARGVHNGQEQVGSPILAGAQLPA